MRKAALLIIAVLCCAGVASAQVAGSVAPFADAAWTTCQMADPGTTGFIYFVHLWTTGATAVEFKVDFPPCVVPLADSCPFALKNGNYKDGTSISYQNCLLGPISLGYTIVTFMGTCEPCTYLTVIENPNSQPPADPGEVYVADCTPGDPQIIIGTGGTLIINPTVDCQCDVPVEDTTWGQVKALFE